VAFNASEKAPKDTQENKFASGEARSFHHGMSWGLMPFLGSVCL
jgi:hypothetical protein